MYDISPMKMSHYVKLIVAQKRRSSKIGERGQEYGKVMCLATSAYFELIFGRCPINVFIVIVVLSFPTPKFTYVTQNGVVATIGVVRKFS